MKNKDNKEKNIQVQSAQPTQKQKKKHSSIIRTAILGTAFGLCASAIVGLSVALYYAQDNIATHKTYQRQMDAVYSRAYYDLLDGASDLGVTLRKIGVSNSKEMQQSLLYDVWSVAQLAEDNLGMFESQDDGILQAQKFVNQLGDYSHSLALRMTDGKPLTIDERHKLLQLGEMADMYKSALQKVQENMTQNKTFTDNDMLSNFVSAFEAFAEPSINYPEMIYDGPFSSALESRKTLGLNGKEISQEESLTMLKRYFNDRKVSNIQYMGEGQGNIATHNIYFDIDGKSAFAQLSKKGGMLISFNSATTGDDMPTIEAEASKTCQQMAIDFAKKIGLDDMQVVWSSSTDGECVVNLAPVQDGVVLYPDLVKVKLDERHGKVIGVDTTHYAYNHCQRNLPNALLSAQEARERLSLPTDDEGRLSLIPLRETKEVLAYEFECEQNGTYYVYIDAMTGEEANILYVIDDDMGMRTI